MSNPTASNPAAKFLSAVFAGILAGSAMTTILHDAADAAEGCLSEPKDQTPGGMHWYYRIDRATKRHCWYLRATAGEPSQAAAPDSSSVPKMNSRKADAAAERSIADAHAELPMPQAPADQGAAIVAPPPTQTVWPNPASALNDPRANAQGSDSPPSAVASRWPEPTGVSSTADPQPATSDQVADARSEQMADASAAPATARSAAPVPVAFAATDVPQAKATGSIRMLAMVILGALALAGLTASVIFRLGNARYRARSAARRNAIWDSADGTRRPPWADQAAHHFARHPEFARSPDADGDPNERVDRITDFLERLTKQARADAEKLRAENRVSEFPVNELSSPAESTRIRSAAGPRSKSL
jgi:hypothetical protein